MTKNIEMQLNLKRSPETVYDALVNVDTLKRWFAEQAAVSLEEKRYDFWGRFTPETPSEDQGKHNILAYEVNRQLKFDWHVRNTNTTVEFLLEPERNGTQLHFLHEGVPAWQPGQYTLADFWTLSLENLRCWVERNTIGARCDFTIPMRGDVRLSVEINAPFEKVFKSLIEPDQLDRYFATQAVVEPQVGGKFSFGWKSGGPVKIVDLVPNEKLSYTWEYKGEPETVVTWELEGSGGKTNLILVHSGFAPDSEDAGYRIGWTGCLNLIKSLAESDPGWEAPKLSATDYVTL